MGVRSFIGVFSCLLGLGLAAPGVVYDQRQEATGTNVHVQLEDFLLVWIPSRTLDPSSLLSNLAVSFKSTPTESGYLGPANHLDVTVPSEFENPPKNPEQTSQIVQEAVLAAKPEIPEPETAKPSSESSTTTLEPSSTSNTPILSSTSTSASSNKPQAQKPTKGSQQLAEKITQAVIDSVTNASPASSAEKLPGPNPMTEMKFLQPVSQAIALLRIKHEPTQPSKAT